ncbi:MAG: hypothetical protein K9N48_02195 [Verrucomicrobia bacterium]|nr:hypothetical protein [Verrucomicrobiota bacterium]MCF7708279.1 hypothetical protein [Verrucomicrobiota bacterium]
MPGLQELIYRLEVGGGAVKLRMITAVLIVVAIAVVFDLREFRNFSNPEAMESAQLARNITEGRGYTTRSIEPLDIYLLTKLNPAARSSLLDNEVPELGRPPVYPYILAALMSVAPMHYDTADIDNFSRYQPEVIIALFNQILLLGAVIWIFSLATRLFDVQVAWLSSALFGATLLFWRFSISGLPTVFLILVFLGVVECLVRGYNRIREEPQRRGVVLKWSVAAAVMVGLGAMTQYSFGWLIIPVCLFFLMFYGKRGLGSALTAFAVFCVVMAPWLVRNYQTSGTLFGTAGMAIYEQTLPFPDNTLRSSLQPDLDKVGLSDLIRKFLVNLKDIVENDLADLGGNWISAFFLVGLLMPFRNEVLSRLRYFIVMCLLTFVCVQALGRTHLSDDTLMINSENLLVIIAPMVFVFGSAMFFTLLDQLNIQIPVFRVWIITGFVIILCAPLLLRFLPPRAQPIAYPPYYPPLIQQVSSYMKQNELMMSDMPWAVAWYGDRKCVGLTPDAEGTFYAINDRIEPIEALFLTPITLNEQFQTGMVKDSRNKWGKFALGFFLSKKVPEGFPLRTALTDVLPEMVFLSGYERWRSPFIGEKPEKF